ncbi:MAG: exosortase/archaeosortase family protein [Gammaproteobacteria bacterium]
MPVAAPGSFLSATGPTPREALLLGALITLAFATTYTPVVQILRQQWATNDTYSFGFLVPFISGYLIWRRRERLWALPVRPSFASGGAIVAAAAGALLLGRLTAIVAFQEVSLVLMLIGMVALMLGLRFVRELWFPLAYLFLMLPMWETITDALHHPSQLLSAWLAGNLLQAVNIPVHREQEYLQLPNITLEVASVCSGVNFLVAVLAIGLPQAYLYLRGWLPRAAVILFAVVVALLSNGVRVATIGFLSYHQLSAAVHGPGHILQGLFVSSIGIVAVLTGVSLLARRYPRIPQAWIRVEDGKSARGVGRGRMIAAGLFGTIVLIGVAGVEPNYPVVAAALEPHALVSFGERWRPVAGTVPARFIVGGQPEELVARAYETSTGQRIELFIGSLAHRGTASALDYRKIEVPADASGTQLIVLTGSSPIRVNRVSFRHADRETFVVYWHELSGRVVAQAMAKADSVGRLLIGAPQKSKLIAVVSEGPVGGAAAADVAWFVEDVVRARSATARVEVAARETR